MVVGSSSTLRDDERRNLDLLLEASLARKQVRFRYRRPTGDAETRAIDPHGMAFVRGAWYLAGYSHERGSDRIFRLSRIEGDAYLVNEGRDPDFDPPASYNVRDTVARLMNPRDDNEHEGRFEEVRLRIAPDAAFMVAEWASSGQALAARFERADDGSGLLTLHEPLERSVWRLLAEYAPMAAVEHPPELRASVRDRLERLRAIYAADREHGDDSDNGDNGDNGNDGDDGTGDSRS